MCYRMDDKGTVEADGFKTVNYPVVKSGFAPQLILASDQQARRLVQMKKIVQQRHSGNTPLLKMANVKFTIHCEKI